MHTTNAAVLSALEDAERDLEAKDTKIEDLESKLKAKESEITDLRNVTEDLQTNNKMLLNENKDAEVAAKAEEKWRVELQVKVFQLENDLERHKEKAIEFKRQLDKERVDFKRQLQKEREKNDLAKNAKELFHKLKVLADLAKTME
jgi:chromosome segregation ATPase